MASMCWYVKAIEQLSSIAKQLALATDLEDVALLVNHALGELLSADAGSLVLRYGDQCYCLPEPDQDILHDGQLLPLHLCNSGWAMLNRRVAVCHDIDLDEHFQFGADRHTFAKSLIIVPLGHPRPQAAISTYWLQKHESSDEEVGILKMLAHMVELALRRVGIPVLPRLQRAAVEEIHTETILFALPRELAECVDAERNPNCLANVLLVEDIEDHLLLTKRLLFEKGGLGCNLQIANNSKQALDQLYEAHYRREPIDLILLDISLPGMDGFQLMQLIQTSDTFRHTPIIMCTVSTDAQDKQRAATLGAAGYLIKPPHLERFKGIVKKLESIQVQDYGQDQRLVRSLQAAS